MRKIKVKHTGKLKKNTSKEGKSIEQKLSMRMEGEEIEMMGKQIIYTDRKNGVLPQYNIRTDKFEIAQNANDYLIRSQIARQAEVDKTISLEQATEGTRVIK